MQATASSAIRGLKESLKSWHRLTAMLPLPPQMPSSAELGATLGHSAGEPTVSSHAGPTTAGTTLALAVVTVEGAFVGTTAAAEGFAPSDRASFDPDRGGDFVA